MRDILNQNIDSPCLGCDIGSGTIIPPGGIICATEHFVLHQDPMIPIPGFLIVASKEHARSIVDFDATARRELVELLYLGDAALKATGITQEVTLVQEERSGHFHVWLFPWHAWMDSAGFNHSIANLRMINAYAQKNRCSRDELDTVLAAAWKIHEYICSI